MPATTLEAVIQMRRGLENDLDINQLRVGEWALSTDTKWVRICYAQGKVIKIASQEAMDATLAEIQAIEDQILIMKNAAAASALAASGSATTAGTKAEDAEAWAVGKRDGVDVPSTDPAYNNNAKYWAQNSTIPTGGTTGQVLAKKSNSDRDTEWVNQSGGGGTGGHTILDSSGTQMADETKLQFNGLSVTDDSANGKTIVAHNINTDAPIFSEASTRANISSGENIATLFGKIKKFFTDLKTVAFTGAYSDLSGIPTIPAVNDGTLTIKQGNTTLGTFSANQSGNTNVNIPSSGAGLVNYQLTCPASGYTTSTVTIWSEAKSLYTITLTDDKDGNPLTNFTSGMIADYPINLTGALADFKKLYACEIGAANITLYFTAVPSAAFNILIKEAA